MGNRHTMFYMGKEYPNIPMGGGSGGGGGELTLLAGTGDTVMSIGNHTLADSLANYDSVLVCVCYQQYTETGLPPAEYPIDLIKIQATDRSYAHYASLGYCDFRYIDDNTIATLRYSGVSITAIYGIKYGGASGGGGGEKTELFTNATTTNPATITFDNPITDYDEIRFMVRAGSNAVATMTYDVENLITGDTIGAEFYTGVFAWYYYTDSQTLTFRVSAGGGYISNIVGIKY